MKSSCRFAQNAASRNVFSRIPQLSTSTVATDEVKIVEVGPRDGLQNEPQTVSTMDKVELIQRLAKAGCKHIEAGSFVSPKWVPSMADSDQVMQHLKPWRENEAVVLSCLVPNLSGLQRAKQEKADEISIFASASEGFSQKNINCSIEESFERFKPIVQEAGEIPVRGYVSCIFSCPYDGRTEPRQVARVTEKLLELGCHEVSLGDTIGVGTPADTSRLMVELREYTPQLAAHFHDTYGQALANVLVALDSGISVVDSSVAGLGGCPYAKGASGNLATEDVVYMLDGMGIGTGIDLEELVDAAEFISNVLGRPSRSKAGLATITKRGL